MTQRILLFFLITGGLLTISSFVRPSTVNTNSKKVIGTVIIDPGHGGSDHGARGQFSNEKDICLAVSLKLGAIIAKEFPELRVLYTRTTDTYPELHDRAKFANENKGDLYLCIHVNAARGKRVASIVGYKTVTYYTGKGASRKKRTKRVPQYKYTNLPSEAKGTETYIWGAHRSEDKELAIIENAPMLQEENFEKNYGGVDVNSPEFIAISLLKTKQYFKRSATLAGFIQDEFAKVGRVDRDVRQRGIGIWVLQATAMPSVLVETGFISNPEEEDYLNSEAGQEELSACMVRGLKNYLTWLEQKQQPENASTNSTTQASTRSFLEAVEEKHKLTKR
ncbi:MAG: N-acetylmuramoyl-L-alanine amidase [Bacteroidetes bacterium]|jgi:N-acetylmuramoyl-L-alanine amidase|nr:N-acetylmuramoyl-L-alanine amidase [Bacteroidota bacterium]